MKLLFLFVASCAFIHFSSVHATNVNEYLYEKLRQSKIEVIKIHIQETSPVQEKLYKIQWDRSWRVPLMSKPLAFVNSSRPFAINMFDEIFILDGNRVMIPFFNKTSWNETYKTLRQVDSIEAHSVIKFVKNIMWNDITYLLLCYETDLCNLYTATRKDMLRFRHTIKHRGTPVDAKFFIQDDQLHLVIANYAGKFSVPSIIYRWSGTYMDVINEVMTIGVISITTFEQRQSTIILFAQYNAENPQVGSEVYEFKDGNIARIQFLSISRPVSMHHYVYSDFNFVLMMNELGPSNVLCWDGQELLDWFSLSEIDPHSLMNIFHVDGDTFIVVAHDNIIQLYKFYSISDWKIENVKQFKSTQKIIDMVVSMNKFTMTVILIIKEKNVYWVEQWQAEMASVTSIENNVKDADETRKSLSDLIEALQARMPAIKKVKNSWKFLLPSAKNLTISEPMKFDTLNLQSGTVENIEIVTQEDILPPHQIEKSLDELNRSIHDVIMPELLKKKEMSTIALETSEDSIMIDDAYLEELEIDQMHVDIINDMEIKSEKIILSERNQNFTYPVPLENIIVDELEVESLCGVPHQYWLLRKDKEIKFAAANNSMEYLNDTIILHSDLTIPKLKIQSLNGTIVDQLINNLFRINHNQTIKGIITYKNSLDITNFTTQMLNGVPADKLMTTTTNQTFDDFHIQVLQIDSLFAKTVNGIPIEEAARKSRENVIKENLVFEGKLKLANLHVTENFTISVNTSTMKMFDERFLHIYENVTILGDLHLRNMKIENTATLFVEDVPVNVNDMLNNSWTKSSDQTITKKITLESGFTIDRLDTKYLNGFAENDFLYTTMKEIPSEFINLRFKNFYVDEFFPEDDSNDSLFQVLSDQLIIRKQLHLQSLQAEDIITLAFNGIDIDDIMNEIGSNFSGTTRLSDVRARRVFVDNLDIYFLNDREIIFEDGLRINDDHQIAILKIPQFNVQKLEVERLNGTELNLLMQLENSDLSRIIIDGDLIVENLTVSQVDGQSIESFLEELGQSDILITSEKNIESLIVENITLESLHGRNFDELFASILSKSREQTISGYFSTNVITSNNVTIDFINKKNTSQFMWVDGPLTIMGNVTFSDLFVEGDVITSKLNGHNVRELYDSLLYIPVKNIDFLKVDEISWETSLTNPTSISYLLKNAVTKTENQNITGKVIFTKNVRAWAVTGAFNEINEIGRIISDAVIDHGGEIEISGKKFFENDFVANKLVVNGDLGIAKVNDVDILKFNDSVVRKYREETIVGPLTFLKDVTIEKLHTNNTDLNASINAAVRSDDVMPDNIFFEELVVGNVHIKNLNNIDFDKFTNERVTLIGNHNISCDLKFNGVVTVTGNAHVAKINGIHPSDFILNNVNEMQMIYGTKIFKEDLIIEGNITAPRVNDVEILKEYNNCVQNDEDVDIFGNLIFKSNVRIQNMNISGLVNGVNLHSAISDSQEKMNKTLQSLEESWRIIEQNIEYNSRVSETLRNIFFYLETEEDLRISGTNVSKIDVVHFNENAVRLNMYSEQPGRFCGLPDNCSCIYQSVIEIIDRNVRKWQVNPGEIIKNFYDPGGIFGVNVITNAVSSSEKCTSSRTKEEITTISLIKSEDSKEIQEDVFDKIEGYLKDASIFKHNDNVYIVLAIYYDKVHATHRTNSLLYRIHMTMKNATLVQEIPTDGAWSIQIFKINHLEVFLLIGCFGESSESSLYRFNPLTQQFEQLRTFASRSRYVKSLSQGNDYFVLLDNPDINAVNIYKYDPTSRNFYHYQNIFHVRQINGIECFYTDDFGNSDMFVIITTQGGRFYIYEYMFAGKFQMKLQHTVDGLRTMMPFYHMDRHYILIGTNDNNVLFRIVKQGPH